MRKKIHTDMPMGEIYPRLLRYSWRYKQWLGFAAIGMAIYAGTDTALIYILKPLLDGSIVDRDPWMIHWIPIFMLGLFIMRGIAGFVSNYGMAWVANRVVYNVRSDVFEKFLHLPASFFDRNTTGRTTAMLTYYTSQISGAATSAITIVIQDSLRIVGFTLLMFWINWSLALITLAVGPIIALIVSHVSKRFRRYSASIQQSMGDITHISEEVLTGQRVVKVFGGEAYERGAFERVNERNQRIAMRKATTSAASVPVIQFIAAIAIAFVVSVAVRNTGGGVMTPGDLATFFGAMMGMMGPIKRLTGVNATIQAGMAAAGAIFELIDEPGEPDRGRRAIERAAGRIEVEGVSFRYPGSEHDVLRDISFNVEPGRTIAFVGRSGSGKSTLLSLLPRFYDAQHGRIALDGVSVFDYRLADLRRQISLVDQNVVLFNDTIAGNIAYGALGGVDRATIEEAAKRAYAAEFIESLPRGYDTLVGQNGLMLSGGQRQRIAIARALLKDAPILILDEATSALDTESEKAIQQGLDNLMRDRTTLVIAHRLSTVQDADRIVVMHDGRLVEQGSHAELMAHRGHYRSLHEIQFAHPDNV
ncbi:lipid A export permease/ATP-binding protein MsbA [Salinisphaera sp.]|uniref:lipid A export permease/ATP-binding protein MsbA n=1 Tax=Salinisphaera sp. TaxID=1914330 RepID=UPI002D76BD98|nr:lipid A export permease/ATP-binding protein MsbA [Salinisphaera sp.]HET7314711.1 lipid A export permease/ATP-binding protein MsbA [Salinisphaera sp.]